MSEPSTRHPCLLARFLSEWMDTPTGKMQPLPSLHLFVLIIVSWCENTFWLQLGTGFNSPGIFTLPRSKSQRCSYPCKGEHCNSWYRCYKFRFLKLFDLVQPQLRSLSKSDREYSCQSPAQSHIPFSFSFILFALSEKSSEVNSVTVCACLEAHS